LLFPCFQSGYELVGRLLPILEPERLKNITPQYSIRTFRYGSLSGQECDLYIPHVSNPPVVCLLHGGFWRMPYGRDELSPIAKDLASQGYAVYNIEYRRLGVSEGGWPGTFNDVATAINHLRMLVNDGIEIDLNRVIFVGHSAGGQLALWAAARNKPENIFPLIRIQPIAVVGLAPIADLARSYDLHVGINAVKELLCGGPSQYPDRYAAASPIELLPLGVKQLIIHGSKDEELPIDLSQNYVIVAQTSGDIIKLVELPDVGHMDYLDPDSKAHSVLCKWIATIV
jgi:acetyl esterase/lipase